MPWFIVAFMKRNYGHKNVLKFTDCHEKKKREKKKVLFMRKFICVDGKIE